MFSYLIANHVTLQGKQTVPCTFFAAETHACFSFRAANRLDQTMNPDAESFVFSRSFPVHRTPMLSNLFAYIEDLKIRTAYGMLRRIKRVKEADPRPSFYPIVLMLHLDEGREPLIERQSLIAFSEWIRHGTPSFTMSVMVERCESQDTEKYLAELDKCLKTQIGESCINVHTLLVTYRDSNDLSETTSAVIQCTEIGALIPNTLVVNFPQFENFQSRKNYNDVALREFWKKIVTYDKKCLAICKGELWRIKPKAELTVDIWWVVEDDDILLLFMYLITNWRKFVDAKVRLFPVISDHWTQEAEAKIVEAINDRVAHSWIVAELSIERIEEDAVALYKGLRRNQNAVDLPPTTTTEEETTPMAKKHSGAKQLNARMQEKSAHSDLVFVNIPKWSSESEGSQRKFFHFLQSLTDRFNLMVLFRPPSLEFNIKKPEKSAREAVVL
uniref:SLC12 domain-containing protein n=1 Tax=Steinernema glaseri TaxID=37863 RepID=A0A1I7Y415_9BILA